MTPDQAPSIPQESDRASMQRTAFLLVNSSLMDWMKGVRSTVSEAEGDGGRWGLEGKYATMATKIAVDADASTTMYHQMSCWTSSFVGGMLRADLFVICYLQPMRFYIDKQNNQKSKTPFSIIDSPYPLYYAGPPFLLLV